MPTAAARHCLGVEMAAKTTVEGVLRQWQREAESRERLARAPQHSEVERRLLRAQANVYRACHRDLRGVPGGR